MTTQIKKEAAPGVVGPKHDVMEIVVEDSPDIPSTQEIAKAGYDKAVRVAGENFGADFKAGVPQEEAEARYNAAMGEAKRIYAQAWLAYCAAMGADE